MSPMKQTLELIAAAGTSRELVKIGRRGIDPPSVFDVGFVVAWADHLVVMHLVTSRLDLDGYDVFRLEDITSVEGSFPREAFYKRALEKKNLIPGDPGPLDLTNVRELLNSAQQRYPVLVIHREKVAPRICEVGRVRLSSDELYALQWLSPEAIWQEDNERYRYSDVTRVQFGNEYENTLAAVAASDVPSG